MKDREIVVLGPHIDISGHEIVNINVSTRGGYRPGSGRKPTVKNVKTLSIRIPQDVSDILDEQPNRSQYIAEAVRFYHQQRQ
jgi:hypothetical protein